MKAHTEADFKVFMQQLQETNQSLDFFCDFKKIAQNIANIKLSLYTLNSLIGAEDLRLAVETIWKRDKAAFAVMDILIAVRSGGKKKVLDAMGNCVVLDHFLGSVDGVMEYLEGTGLAELFKKQEIKNLVDYVFGIETGLDSNARKNRSGKIMEAAIGKLLAKYGFAYREQVGSSEWENLTEVLGEDEKVFDFVFEAKGTTYLCEVNFYSGGGSKLNEVARSYSDIAPKVNKVHGFEFVWITDGIGWYSAKSKLQEAFYVIPNVFNLTSFKSFLDSLKK